MSSTALTSSDSSGGAVWAPFWKDGTAYGLPLFRDSVAPWSIIWKRSPRRVPAKSASRGCTYQDGGVTPPTDLSCWLFRKTVGGGTPPPYGAAYGSPLLRDSVVNYLETRTEARSCEVGVSRLHLRDGGVPLPRTEQSSSRSSAPNSSSPKLPNSFFNNPRGRPMGRPCDSARGTHAPPGGQRSRHYPHGHPSSTPARTTVHCCDAHRDPRL